VASYVIHSSAWKGSSPKFALGVCPWHHLATSSPAYEEGEDSVFTEENKTLVRLFVDEVQSGGNIDALDEICSPAFVNHRAPPRVPSNCEAVKQPTAMIRQAFPDSYFTVEDMMAEGDKLATRKTFHGTHQGEFMGIPRPADGCLWGSSISCVSPMGESWSTGLWGTTSA
jgi:SnoaL-like polyketide cyclase